MSSETSIYRAMLRAIYQKYGLNACVRKTHSNMFTGPGTPDLVGVVLGRAVMIEAKVPGKEPTKIQLHELSMYKRAQAITGSARSVEDVMRLIEEGLCIPLK